VAADSNRGHDFSRPATAGLDFAPDRHRDSRGFPIALVVAWAFDVGLHGLKETAPAAAAEDCPPALAPKWRNIYLLAAIDVVAAAGAGFFLLPRVPGSKLDKSIAVLPFDNFSENKENEHFADGIQDDVLTSLAKIGELKVISRSSVMP
jgi:hypothetical protein